MLTISAEMEAPALGVFLPSVAFGAIVLIFIVTLFDNLFPKLLPGKRSGSQYPPELPFVKIPLFGHLVYVAYYAIARKRLEDIVVLISRRLNNAPLFRMMLGRVPFTLLCKTDVVKEVLRMEGCSFRRDLIFFKEGPFKNGVTASNGERWQRLRRFAAYSFKHYGTAREDFDTLLNNELEDLLKAVLPVSDSDFKPATSNNGSVFTCSSSKAKRAFCCRVDFKEHPVVATMNVVMWIFTKQRLKYGSSETDKLCKAVKNYMGNGALPDTVNLVSGATKLCPKGISGMKDFESDSETLRAFFVNLIMQQLETREPGKPRHALDDLVDEFIGNEVKEISREVLEEEILGAIVDYIASADSAATAFSWCLVYVAANPWAQRRMQSEISALGLPDGQYPSYNLHKKELPYTLAVLSEALRLGTPAPFLFEHFAKEDLQLPTCVIPKGSAILPNVYQCHRDKKYWPHPEVFWPERYLTFTADGKVEFQPKDSLLVFSTGRRKCLGENLTWHMLFKYISGILTLYDLELTGKDAEIALKPDPKLTFVRVPTSTRIIVRTRQQHQ